MSEGEKDNKDFEFIKEQVIERKGRKIKKWLLPLIMTVIMSILFGVIAAVTFVLTEPKLYKLLHKDEEAKTPIVFPTTDPNENKEVPTTTPKLSPTPKVEETTDHSEEQDDSKEQTSDNTDSDAPDDEKRDPIIVEQSIEADLDDFVNMYEKLRLVAYETNKSLVSVNSIINETDWFGNPVERTISTTGVIIGNNSKELLILVSLDRVKDTNRITIKFTDTVSIDATLLEYDTEINMAVLAISLTNIPISFLENLKVVKMGESYSISVGNPIIALGSPNGHPGSMELGIITSKGSSVTITDNKLDLFNTNIVDNKNSDGIVVNMNGEVIGFITHTLKEDINENLNTVIGVSKVKPIIERLANQQPLIYFGVETEDMTESAKREHDISNGIYVNEVRSNSPAFEAGVINGDIIIQVNDASVLNTNNFNNIISEYEPGEQIMVKIKRTSGNLEKEMDLPVVLREKVKK